MAHITIHGNLAGDPKIYDTKDGGKVAQLRVIENRRWQDESGNWQEGEPEGHNVTLWGGEAENSMCLRKGDTVLVVGTTYTDAWTDENGEQRRTTKVRARHVGISLRYTTALIDRSDEPMGKRNPVRTRAGSEAAETTPDQDHSS